MPAETYTKACSKLLTQYKAALRVAEVSDGKSKSNLNYLIKMPSIFRSTLLYGVKRWSDPHGHELAVIKMTYFRMFLYVK